MADLAGEPRPAADELAVLEDAGADADGAGEVERVAYAAGSAVVRLGVRRAVGVVADLDRAAGDQAGDGLREVAALDVEVGRPRDRTVVVAHQRRDGQGRPDHLPAVDVPVDHLAHQVGERVGACRRTAVAEDHGATEVEDDGRHVVDVELEAEAGVPVAAQRDGPPGAAAGARSRVLLDHGPRGSQARDDHADRRLGEPGVLRELGARGRAVLTQGAQDGGGVLPPQPLGPGVARLRGQGLHRQRTP